MGASWAAGETLSAAHIYRESIPWWPWDSTSNMRNSLDSPPLPPSILLSAQLCFLIIVRPMKSINYPSLQSYWKGSEKKQREMRAANPFFIPLVALNKRRMCCLSVTEGIKSSGLSHAFSAPCRASLRETEWRGLQQHPARTLHIIW